VNRHKWTATGKYYKGTDGPHLQQVVIEFRHKSASRGRGGRFCATMWRDTDQSGALQSAAAVSLSCRFWGLDDPFAAYTAAETPNAFQWVKRPPKLPLPLEDVDPHLIHGSLDQHESASNGISIGSAGLELFFGFHPRPDRQCRLFVWNVPVRSVLVHSAR